jgi:glutathione S-transferase
MSIVIHGAGASPFVRKVRVVLTEKGIPFELNPVMPVGVSDEFKKISPLGKIPVFQDGDFTLPDSSCIIAYLERTHPTPALYPSDPEEFGRALFYEEYSDTKLTETLGPIFFQRFVRKNLFKQEPDEALVAEKLEQAEPVFDFLEATIGDRDVVVGRHFSVADVALGSVFANFGLSGEKVDAARWPNLAGYVERILARPSFKTCLEQEQAALPS